jgi:hypothetical protein
VITFSNLSSVSTITTQVPVPSSYLDGILFQSFAFTGSNSFQMRFGKEFNLPVKKDNLLMAGNG